MTAVASPPTFPQINRPAWGGSGTQTMNSMNPDEVRGMFLPRKTIQRSNSSSSISSTSSTSSNSTVATPTSSANGTPVSANADLSQWPPSTAPRKRPQPKGPWPDGKRDAPADMSRIAQPQPRPPMANGGPNAMQHPPPGPPQQANQAAMARPMASEVNPGQPVLYLLSLNGTFERKTISVPFYPDSLRIGRQTNQKTIPTPTNGFFDSKVLSRQHAEIWADRGGKIWIRDVKSSNGTFVNGSRLSQENRESEPHELSTSDHLELGIDIVSEDQKTVVHHKVAAKVEHAGFLSSSSNVLDMNFGDLDPANGAMMMPGAGPMQFRGRAGNNAAMANNGRMMAAANMMGAQGNGVFQRPPWLTTVTTEFIVKKLHNDMRTARQQAQDLNRTHQFISMLLSKDDVKDMDKPEVPEPPKPQGVINGSALPFRPDTKNRFSDPPAPPPQAPLPEKPDVPSLKRGTTERPKSHPINTSPIRQDNLSQIIHLTEQLNDAKRRIDTQNSKMRDLEEKLQKEREARELAEDLARRLEDTAGPAAQLNGLAKVDAPETLLEEAFEPPHQIPPEIVGRDIEKAASPPVETAEVAGATYQARIDTMMADISSLKQQLEAWKHKCEKAEKERDEGQKSLAEMVAQIRKDKEAELAKNSVQNRGRGRSKGRKHKDKDQAERRGASISASSDGSQAPEPMLEHTGDSGDEPVGVPTLSRQNTITPDTPTTLARIPQDQALQASLPYASMLGVVLIGMGLMAYLNGWQSQPRLDR